MAETRRFLVPRQRQLRRLISPLILATSLIFPLSPSPSAVALRFEEGQGIYLLASTSASSPRQKEEQDQLLLTSTILFSSSLRLPPRQYLDQMDLRL